MPNYDFRCSVHGLFEMTKPMSECALPVNCPTCGALSPRAITATGVIIPPQHQSAFGAGKSLKQIEKNYRGSAADPNYGKKKG